MFRVILSIISFLFFISISAQQLSIQTGHSSAILDMEFSPDGNILASSGADNKIVLWDMISSKQMNILSGHNGVVNSISFHPAKHIIASASDDGTVKLWKYPSGELLKTYEFFNNKVKSVDFSPNGIDLACGSDYVYIVDIETDKHKKIEKKAKYIFNALTYNNKGDYIAFGETKSRKNYIYNLSQSKIEKVIKIKSNLLLFSENDEFLYSAGKKGIIKKVRVSKNEKNKEKKFVQYANYSWNSFNSVILFNDYLIAANKDNYIYLYDKNNGKRIEILKAHRSYVRTLAINKKGNYIASAGNDRKILLWNVNERKVIKILEGSSVATNSISFTKDGNTMFIAYQDGSFKTWDLLSKSDINYSKFNYDKKGLFSTIKDYSTQQSTSLISSKKIIVKVNKIKMDKYSGAVSAEYENIALWNLKYNTDLKRLINNKTTEYQNYYLIDTNNVISIKSKATHSQKFSLLDHKKIKDREEVFSISVSSCTVNENKKKIKLKNNKTFKIKGDIYYKAINSSGTILLVLKGTKEGTLAEIWDINKRVKINSRAFDIKINNAKISSKNKYVFVSDNDENIYVLDYNNLEQINKLKGNFPLTCSNNENMLTYTNKNKELFLYNLVAKKPVFQIKTYHQTDISDIKFNKVYNYIATSSYDGLIKLWDTKTGDLIVSMAAFKDNDFVYISPENYYFSTKKATDYIGFLYKDRLYSFEQFDLKFNRPDIVFANSGYSNKTELNTYNRAYIKRIKKLGFDKDAFESGFDIPSLTIKNINELPIQTSENSVNLKLNLNDSTYKIDRLNIWINDVAVYGTNGINLRDKDTKNINKDINLELAQGENKIQVSCINQKGAESYKETTNITYKPKKKIQPNLYLITIGTSKYKDERFNLQYAAKDAQDVVNLFSQNKYFGKVITKTLTNEQVTNKNVTELKSFLEPATRNDQVIIFVAGHGVLDGNLEYYLASNDMDFNKPEEKGIPYGNLEKLLDGIKPLKKILFVDACHSGEIDKEDMELAEAENTEHGDVVFRAVGANVVSKSLEAQNTSALSKELFTDLRRGTGATVVSSAGGGEYAMESGEWKNGLFTYSLINGIKSKEADINKDGKIMLSELQKYVQNQVVELSGGMQQPTSRIENISMDFRVW